MINLFNLKNNKSKGLTKKQINVRYVTRYNCVYTFYLMPLVPELVLQMVEELKEKFCEVRFKEGRVTVVLPVTEQLFHYPEPYRSVFIEARKNHLINQNEGVKMKYKCQLSEINEIQRHLNTWREERHLSVEGQAKGLVGNLFEEVSELERGYSAKDEHEIVDSLCDIMVFSLNCVIMPFPYFELSNSDMQTLVDKIISLSYVPHRDRETDFLRAAKQEVIHEICRRVAFMLEKRGYNWFFAMMETVTEISSRKGTYDETIGKFVKDTSDEAKALWYKADYTKALKT